MHAKKPYKSKPRREGETDKETERERERDGGREREGKKRNTTVAQRKQSAGDR